ncbi:caspase-8-like [Limanda limanda]|uniref:caspase-8-like n=1 Tax=Limanda limanda TaxID=27771 RepID=UPI0029C7817F|nr:caspase-8-like [Limanda limanda]
MVSRNPKYLLMTYASVQLTLSDTRGMHGVFKSTKRGTLYATANRTNEDRKHLAMMERILGPVPDLMVANTRKKYFLNGHLKWDKGSLAGKALSQKFKPLEWYMKSQARMVRQLFDVIKKMLRYDPAKRLTLADALEDPFFKEEWQKAAKTPSVRSNTWATRSVSLSSEERYLLESQPVGLCVIINNEHFMDGTMRRGTDKDAECLAEVFTWLRFRVLMCKDQTKDQMERALRHFASLSDPSRLQDFNVKEWICSGFTELKTPLKHGDAFICCILSHGLKGEVFETDWKSLTIKQITKTFKSSDQSALTGKPKVFLIQACQGPHRHRGVLLADLEADDSSLQCIPEEADVLVAFATVEDHVSYRSTTEGSWFIQGVCQKLKEGCCRNDDFITILKRVNKDVSQKEGTGQCGAAKQMPEVRFTLRKSLLLSPLGASSLLS